ncbi:very short patch repair endonuclease [Roseibium aestuarii]|uniref:Very short patch repair endonuclease n=1 Tax=Roseibium aestuarii TaxID=2600299 RepID=A0ABW4JU43_9HYPH|nr:very short patch repair endonuclease [Roseibium aestuarii]
MDVVDKTTRSRMMAGIRSKDTRPEIALRRELHSRGLRYRLHGKDLPGKPDLVLARYKAVILVHGCFWHRHQDCRYASTPSTRPEFWQAKFERNISRDAEVRDQLGQAGWRVATVWECALRKPQQVIRSADILETWLASGEPELTIGEEKVAVRPSPFPGIGS